MPQPIEYHDILFRALTAPFSPSGTRSQAIPLPFITPASKPKSSFDTQLHAIARALLRQLLQRDTRFSRGSGNKGIFEECRSSIQTNLTGEYFNPRLAGALPQSLDPAPVLTPTRSK